MARTVISITIDDDDCVVIAQDGREPLVLEWYETTIADVQECLHAACDSIVAARRESDEQRNLGSEFNPQD